MALRSNAVEDTLSVYAAGLGYPLSSAYTPEEDIRVLGS
jgi:hypothetical protein